MPLVMVLVAAGATVAGGPAVAAASEPVVSGVSPSSGSTDGGTTVTIKGERFHHVRKVLFGSAAGTSVHVKSATKLTVRAPQHSAGTISVRVEAKAGESSRTTKDHFTYKPVWTPHEAPIPGHAKSTNVMLHGLACGSAGSCVAVGQYLDAKNHQRALIDRLADGHWEALAAPLPAKANSSPGASLSAVDCPTGGACVAVGIYVDSGNHVDGLVDTLSHGSWSAMRAPLPNGVATGSTTDLDAVACHSAGSCAAVGTYTLSNGTTDPLLETLASGKWSATEAPLPADATTPSQNDQLSAVVCPAAGTCSAVGVYDNPQQVGLVETLANGGWHGHKPKLPNDASTGFQSVVLPSVACRSATACTAVGQYVDKAAPSHQQGVIETLPVGLGSGSKAAVPPDGSSQPSVGLAAVSCAASGCTAVGSYRDKKSAPAGLIEPLAGPGHATHAPLPADAGTTFGALEAIACPATRSCTAVGLYTDKHGASQGVLDIESGISWHPIEAPVPGNAMPGTSVTGLTQIVCPSTTSCVAIGGYLDKNSAMQGLLEEA